MTDLPKYDGPRMVPLLDGTLVFSDSEEYRHLCEARSIVAMPAHLRGEHMYDIERIRGVDAARQLWRTIEELRVSGQGAT